ncbi:MAG TPA: CapA family protein, partial [Candidatus Sulfotelmatobacter sp.]|nr:CapA family protein [Candidatus Sulfotelmatobacter sp.]
MDRVEYLALGSRTRRDPRPRRGTGLLLGAAVLVAVAAGALFLSGFLSGRSAVVPQPFPHEIARVTFAASGDVIPHEAVRAAAAAEGQGEQGWEALFSDVADVFRSADFGFVNMETPVAPAHSTGSKPFMFDAPI